MKTNSYISFVLDDKVVTIDFSSDQNYTPTTTLLNYLRSLPDHKGVKEGCAEGDCGACTIVVAEKIENKIIYKAYDSCLVFLPMVHGKQVITVENLGQWNSLHPVQEALVKHDGSQCGYCTPGFVMSTFSLYKNEKAPSKETINDYLTGNLCRCTGYRPIIDAAKAVTEKYVPDSFDKNSNETIQLLQTIDTKTPILVKTKSQEYFKPFALSDALDYLELNADALIISGSTDVALRVTKKKEILPKIIDIGSINELKYITEKNGQIHIGAGTNLDDLNDFSKKSIPALHDILKVFGSKQIRKLATIGGNIASASPIGDTIPFFMASDAVIILTSKNNRREEKLVDFITSYRKTTRKTNELITEVILPNPGNAIIKSYKISKRKDLDISTVSATFFLESENSLIKNIKIFYGGMAALTSHAVETEKFLIGKEISESTFIEAQQYIAKDFVPISDARSGKEARMIMAKNLLLKFWSDLENN